MKGAIIMNKIAIIGTGADGNYDLWDGHKIERGNHLRWFFDPSLGFPHLGFNLYRRDSGRLVSVQVEELYAMLEENPIISVINANAGITIKTSNQAMNLSVESTPFGLGLRIAPSTPIEIILPDTAWFLKIELHAAVNGKLKVSCSLQGNTVFSTEITSHRLIHYPDGVDQVKLEGDGWLTLFSIDPRSPTEGWQPYASICLPVTHARYPCRHSRTDGTIAGDEAEAKARLPQQQEILDRYVNGPAVGGTPSGSLRPFLDKLYPELLSLALHEDKPPQWIATTLSSTHPRLENVNRLNYLLLFALNPYIARILGLYYVDKEAHITPPKWYDYKIEGHWLQDGASQGTIELANMPKIHGSTEAWHKGLTLTSSVPAKKVNKRVEFQGSNIRVNLELPPFHINRITINGGRLVGIFRAKVTYGDGTTKQYMLRQAITSLPRNSTIATTTSDQMLLVVIEGSEIKSIEITGSGRLTLGQLLYETNARVITHSAIAYHLSTSEPQHLPKPPMDLMPMELKGWPMSSAASGAGGNPNAVGLHWKLDLDKDETGKDSLSPDSVLMGVEWYNFGNPSSPSSIPDPTGSEAFKLLNLDNPVLALPITSSSYPSATAGGVPLPVEEIQRRAALEFLIDGRPPSDPLRPQPAVDALYYMHTNIPDGWHGYRVRSIDIFGRISIPDTTNGRDIAVVFIQNKSKPQAPLLLEARYMQPDDPPLLLTASEKAWRDSDPGNSNKYALHIVWAWPPAYYRRWPKALTFRTYGPIMEAQSITIEDPKTAYSGSIKKVTSGASGSVVEVLNPNGAITNVKPVGKLVNQVSTDITVQDGRRNAFVGASIVQGGNHYKILEHTEGANVVFWVEGQQPATGAFVLDHSIVKTNIKFHRGAELLVGGDLDVVGVKSTIVAYNGGSEFLVKHKDPLTPPPSTGKFLIVPPTGERSFVTVEANGLLSRLASSELRKIGGWLVQGPNEFDVLGVWDDASSAGVGSNTTYFLVSHLTNDPAPSANQNENAFVYHPTYEKIFELTSTVSSNIPISAAAALAAIIRKAESDDITGNVTITTDLDLVCDRTVFSGGMLQVGAHTYKILKVISLSPFILVIEKPDKNNPLPAVNSSCVLSSSEGSVVGVLRTSKAGKRWRWFAGGTIEQAAKKFSVIGYTRNADLIVLGAGGSLPNVGTCTYRPVDSNISPTAQGMVNITVEDPKNGESIQSTPLFVTAVHRSKPSPPQMDIAPPDSGCIMAEPADWYGQSSFTLSGPATQGLMYHVYRALDAAIYDLDRKKRMESATHLPAITSADLPVHIRNDPQVNQIRQAIQAEITNLDNKIDAWKNAAESDKPLRLTEIEKAYKGLRYDTSEVLANMQHTLSAYALLTKEPIKPIARPGGTFEIKFRDDLPGRSKNRFFYRIASTDSAGNRSDFSNSSPPVCCPDVVPPNRPLMLEAIGGDRVITLRWIENSDEDLDYYLLYRANAHEASLDTRTMTLHKRIAKNSTAALRTGEISPHAVTGKPRLLELNDTVSPNINYYYRLVAVDTNRNVSQPSSLISGLAYQLPPSPPVWDTPQRTPITSPTSVLLSWTHSTDQHLSCLVERRLLGTHRWASASGWLMPGVYIYRDTPPDIMSPWEYRLRVRDDLGQMAMVMPTVILPPATGGP